MKQYIKPKTEIIKAEINAMIAASVGIDMSQTTTPDESDAKGNSLWSGSSNIWEDEEE